MKKALVALVIIFCLSGCSGFEPSNGELQVQIEQLRKDQEMLVEASIKNSQSIKELAEASRKNSESITMIARIK